MTDEPERHGFWWFVETGQLTALLVFVAVLAAVCGGLARLTGLA